NAPAVPAAPAAPAASPAAAPAASPPAASPAASAVPAAAAPASGAQPKKGGRLVVGQSTDYISGVDPGTVTGNESVFEMLTFYNPLLRATQDGVGIEGGVAEKWDSEEGGKSWLFTIRNGIKFRDGTPVKASDVKWSLDRIRNTDGLWKPNYTQIDRVDAVDDGHVRVRLKTAWAPILSALAMFPSVIMPQKDFDVPN